MSGVVTLVGTLEAVAIASASAASRVDEFLASFGEGGLGRLDLVHRSHHRLARLDEVGASRLDIADSGDIIGEQLAVAVEHFDVALGVHAELLMGRHERFLRIGHTRLRRLDPCLGRRNRILRRGRLLSRLVSIVSVVIIAARRRHQGDGDQRRHGLAPSDAQRRTHAPAEVACSNRHEVDGRAQSARA